MSSNLLDMFSAELAQRKALQLIQYLVPEQTSLQNKAVKG